MPNGLESHHTINSTAAHPASLGADSTKTPLTPRDLINLPRLSSPAASFDGRSIVYTHTQYFEAERKSQKSLWLTYLSPSARPLTQAAFNFSDDSAVWLDNQTVAFLSSRGGSGTTQLWTVSTGQGSQPQQITRFPITISNVRYNARAQLLAFSAAVYADGSMEEAARRDSAEKTSKPDSGLAYERLFVRHWDHFIEPKKQNLFVVRIRSSAAGHYQLEGVPINLMAGGELESPLDPFGGVSDYQFSPDEIAFVSRKPGREQAWNPKTNIYVVSTDGSTRPRSLTDANPGVCSFPAYSPDGKQLAWLQMSRAGYESDRNQIVVAPRRAGSSSADADSTTALAAPRAIAARWDRSASSIVWLPSGTRLLVTAEDQGHNLIFSIDLASGTVAPVTQRGSNSILKPLSDQRVLLTRSMMHRPTEIYIATIASSAAPQEQLQQISFVSAPMLNAKRLVEPESFWFRGANNTNVQGWLLKPVNFQPGKKYRMVLLIHGGPQGSWTDSFSYRWNPNVFASAGLAVVAINPHGSVGFGQAFTDAVQQRWGSWPFEDLMKGVDHVSRTFSFVDTNRACALGASYGAYMVNWINGHTDRFRCLVSHDGRFSTEYASFYTDELYFPESEFGGVQWERAEAYAQWSPARHIAHWQTPTLVIHGDKGKWYALQRRNVPSRLLYFPDENHWVSKPANSLRWHQEVLAWIQRYNP
ncbi:S9C family peptidase [Thamnocephalis sphaerospora]|uniref:Dipeptidyl-peptidase V n=1 Tax=Thamnocephalis sphaerospora TaxID=78915 RepID=A0A4P9XWM1_9FUNG|nr:S9C family peptidase [Thamnocephalis sphaerospora]|eukprot:RKP10783.1 S9C family peptidase [Thamnocephalis sphaerospora]